MQKELHTLYTVNAKGIARKIYKMQGDQSNILTIFSGLRNVDGKNVAKNVSDYSKTGMTIGEILPGVGGGIGAAVGAGVGLELSAFQEQFKVLKGWGTKNSSLYDKYKNQSGHADLFDGTAMLVLTEMQKNPTKDWADTFNKSLSDFKNDMPDCASYYAMKYLSGQWPLANDGARAAGLPYHYEDFVNSGGRTTIIPQAKKTEDPATDKKKTSTQGTGTDATLIIPPSAGTHNKTIYYIMGAVAVILIVAIIIKKKS